MIYYYENNDIDNKNKINNWTQSELPSPILSMYIAKAWLISSVCMIGQR